jgi:hypothetical protein
MTMPHAHPQQDETYLCTPRKLDKTLGTAYIVGFAPNATSKTAHHMLLYGCKYPGKQEPVFNCGSMTERSVNKGNRGVKVGQKI